MSFPSWSFLLATGALLATPTLWSQTSTLSEGPRLNEVKANIPDDDHAQQYLELIGPAGMRLEGVWLLVIEGTPAEQAGTLDLALDLSEHRLGANGLLIVRGPGQYANVPAETTVLELPEIRTYDEASAHPDGLIEHDAITFALVQGKQLQFRPGQDLDPRDSGKLELPKGAVLVDSLGWDDNGEGRVYSPVVLAQATGSPGAASRLRGCWSANDPQAWACGDVDETGTDTANRYDPNAASPNLPPNAHLTPGKPNFVYTPFALLNEVADERESGPPFFEILTNPGQRLDGIQLVGIANGTAVFCLDLTGQQANREGLFSTQFGRYRVKLAEAFQSNYGSLHLVYSPEKSLRISDFSILDGLLVLPEGVAEMDHVGWNRESPVHVAGDVRFFLDSTPQGFSRYRDNRLVDASAWTYGRLNRDHYVATESKNQPVGAFVTPGRVNIAELAAPQVFPTVETARSTYNPPDADDPAFWHHPTDPAKSLVIATQKEAGYSIYNADGQTLRDVQHGNIRYNNVDVVYGFALQGKPVDLAIFSDRDSDQLHIFRIVPYAPYLIDVTDLGAPKLFGGEPGGETAYGLTAFTSLRDGQTYAIVTQNGTNVVTQVRLQAQGEQIGWEEVRRITLAAGEADKHAEGLVVDVEYDRLYLCQEDVAIYRTAATPAERQLTLTAVDVLAYEGQDNLRADIEGIGLYPYSNGGGVLIVSSQGSNTFGVYDRVSNAYLGAFAVVSNGQGIDGSQECDGLDVTNRPFGPKFPQGLLIVHDGQDTTDTTGDVGTNFKWVPWASVAEAMGLEIDTTADPRKPVRR